MSDGAADMPERTVRRRVFRPAGDARLLSRDAAAREGSVVRFAIEQLGMTEAQAFLNDPNDSLDGRPLLIAAASAEGLHAVRAAILDLAAGGSGQNASTAR